MILKYNDEQELQRTIAKKLSYGEFSFEKTPSTYFCDIVDLVHGIYIEVKPDKFNNAPTQLLYGLAKEYHVKKEQNFSPQLIGLANSSEVMFYKVPDFNTVISFGREVDPSFLIVPSQSGDSDKTKRALELLGAPVSRYTYDGPFKLDTPYTFITVDNILYIIKKLANNEIDIADFIVAFADVYPNNGNITCLKTGGIIDNINGSKLDCKKIKPKDVDFIQSLRITPEQVDALAPIMATFKTPEQRAKLGKFFTNPNVANIVADIIKKHIEPSFIVEPFAGTGNLLQNFFTPSILNDISREHIGIAEVLFTGRDFSFDNIDIIDFTAEEIVKRWEVPKGALVYSNPPFGGITSELRNQGTLDIKYRPELVKYGKGDLCIPAIGQMIEIAKLTAGYLAFFCPMGVFCGRKRYNPLLKQLLENFEFLEGIIFSGDSFNDVAKGKPIAFTIWKPGRTNHTNMVFDCNGNSVKFSNPNEFMLLKKGWKYNECGGNSGDFLIGRKEIFNISSIGIFHTTPKAAGSRVIPTNIKIELESPLSSEMTYALWSSLIDLVGVPLTFDNAYVHIPKKFNTKPHELLLVCSILEALRLNYAPEHIGFLGLRKQLKFGTLAQTIQITSLLNKHKEELIGKEKVETILNKLKEEEQVSRIDIRDYARQQLEVIRYWNNIIIDY